jgi:hypothetical protein
MSDAPHEHLEELIRSTLRDRAANFRPQRRHPTEPELAHPRSFSRAALVVSNSRRLVAVLAGIFVLAIAGITWVVVPHENDQHERSDPAAETHRGNVDTEYLVDQAMDPTVVVEYPGRGNASPVTLVAYRVGHRLCIELRDSARDDFGRKQCDIPAARTWPTTMFASTLETLGERYVIGVVNPDVVDVQVQTEEGLRSVELTTAHPFPSLRFFVDAIDRRPVTLNSHDANGALLTSLSLKRVAPLGPKPCRALANEDMATSSGRDADGNAICIVERRIPRIGSGGDVDFAIYYEGVSVYGVEQTSCSLPNRETTLGARLPGEPEPDGKHLVAGTLPVGANGVRIVLVDGTSMRVGVHAVSPIAHIPVFVVKTDARPNELTPIGAETKSKAVPGCDPLR